MKAKHLTFRDYVTSRQAEARTVDWEQRKAEWLGSLEQLYGAVEGWLAPFGASGVTCERVPVQLDEEQLGQYQAQALRIAVVDEVAWLQPVGALIIAARGRVDLRGRWADQRLVLVPETSAKPTIRVSRGGGAPAQGQPTAEPVYTWRLATEPPDVRYLELTEETFLDALLRAVNADV